MLIEVAFKGNRREFFTWDATDPPPLRAAVIVEADRGEDLGRVHAIGELAEQRATGVPHRPAPDSALRKARRLATTDEAKRVQELREQDEDARRKAMERVRANGLVMKLTDAEWQFDRKKLTIFFTAEKRVDFRNLVRDLASLFRARIELKQIGVRDEAKRLGGVGRCGREYCSASWLPELRPVNLGVAKDQRLSLNPSQISGACGRLMCCLRYEHDFYVQSRKRFPKEGRILYTSKGEEKVVANDIFRERVTLRSVDGEVRVLALADLKVEIQNAGSETPTLTLMSTTAEHEALVLPEEMDEEVIRLQDTAERPAYRPGMGRRLTDRPVSLERKPAGGSGAAPRGADTTGAPPRDGAPSPAGDAAETAVPRPASARAPVGGEPQGVGATPAEGDEDESPADATADAGGDARPRRRRGRRGGRRGRGGEHRASGTEGAKDGGDDGGTEGGNGAGGAQTHDGA